MLFATLVASICLAKQASNNGPSRIERSVFYAIQTKIVVRHQSIVRDTKLIVCIILRYIRNGAGKIKYKSLEFGQLVK